MPKNANEKFIVVYRPHGRLLIETEYFGPFDAWIDADDFLCALPALGLYDAEGDVLGTKGVKYIAPVKPPEVKHAA